jgi:hypothetical protein
MELDLYMYIYLSMQEAIVVVIAYQLDLQLPMQSVPITTKVVRLNPAQVMCTRCNIM